MVTATLTTSGTGIEATGRAAEANIATAQRAFAYLMTPPERRDVREREAIFAPAFESFGPARHNCSNHPAVRPGHDLFGAFSDMDLQIEKMTASGDRVISHVRFSGRHTGWYEGHPPTGRVMTAEGMVVHRIEGGQITEQWSVLRWR